MQETNKGIIIQFLRVRALRRRPPISRILLQYLSQERRREPEPETEKGVKEKRRGMSSTSKDGQKKASFHEKLQQLRSVTNSNAVNKASIIVDASRYIEELKERVEQLKQDVSTSQGADDQGTSTVLVKVETLEKGFLVNVFSAKNCPGLLVSILEAFEKLGLELLDARVSCSDNFSLEAVSEREGEVDGLDERVVTEAVLQAIRN